jgi:hypothetical protein
MKSPPFLAGLLLAWFATSTPWPASANRVAALVPQFEPPASAELRDRFHNALARGLEQGGGEVVPATEVRARLSASAELQGCTVGPCLAKVISELKADRLVTAEISVSGKNYTIALRLVDQGGQEVWRATERCEICTVREADEAAARAATRVGPWLERPGPTDQARQAEKKAVRAPEPPAAAERPSPRVLVEKPPERRRMNGYRAGWIAALAVGGALAVASVPFLYYASRDGDTTCDPSVPRANCPTVYQGNLEAGLGLLLGGGVGLSGGVFGILFYLDRQYEKRRQARAGRLGLVPTVGGAAMSLEGRF